MAPESGRITIGFPRMHKEPGEHRDFLPPLIGLLAGPRIHRPGFAPVRPPSRMTGTPFTRRCSMPTEYWWGSVYVARSAMTSGSKTATSASMPSAITPRSS